MRIIISLTLIASLSYTTPAFSNTCSQSFTSESKAEKNEISSLRKKVNSLERENKRKKDNWDTAVALAICALCPPLLLIAIPAAIYMAWADAPKAPKVPKKSFMEMKLSISHIKEEDYLAAREHIQQLEENLGLSQKKAIRLAIGAWSNALSFDNSTQSQELLAEIDHLTSYWGLSKSKAFQLITTNERPNKKPTEVLQKISEILEEAGQLSREEAKKIIQSFETISLYLIKNLSIAVSTLSQAGFTKEQIIQIIKLNTVRERQLTTDNPFNPFQRENTSLSEKRNKLRQAGFTEEEINRIPIRIMQQTKGDRIESAIVLSFTTGAFILMLDGLQWLFTGSSFIW